jgi:N-acetylmuramic acid 6-phosphate etherase
MASLKRILGIEGGGTKTEWVLLDGDAPGQPPLAQGLLPASNLRLISDDSLSRLFSVLPRDATHVGAFLAGCGTEEDRARLLGLAKQAWPEARIAVGSDRDSGMAAAFGDEDGIVVIAGTGAAVHGRKEGAVEKAGGWGQLLGDRGGGYDLAMQGLRLVLTHYDLNQKITPLAEEILRTLGLNRLSDLVGWAMQAEKMSVAKLAPAIFHAAKYGEPEMLSTVQAAAAILAEYTRAVAQRLVFPKPRVQLLGGLFTHHEDYVSLYKYRLSILLPAASVEVCRVSGALGAAWNALRPESGDRTGGSATGPWRKGDKPEREESSVPQSRDANLELSGLSRDSGLSGLDLSYLAAASTEQSNPRSAELDQRGTRELVELFITEEEYVSKALAACREPLIAAIDLTSAALAAGGRLFYVGAGTSGRLGVLDASEIPPTFGAPPELVQGIIAGGAPALRRAVEGAEDEPEAGAFAVLERGARAGDVVCGLTASGRTPFVIGALERASALGARTILISCNPARARPRDPGFPLWDVEIHLPTGPEIVTGSTRLKAGTATKLALNMLSTITMIRLGRVRGNAMVDLRVSNAKLRDRSIRLVSSALGLSYDEARARLESAQWNVRACLE